MFPRYLQPILLNHISTNMETQTRETLLSPQVLRIIEVSKSTDRTSVRRIAYSVPLSLFGGSVFTFTDYTTYADMRCVLFGTGKSDTLRIHASQYRPPEISLRSFHNCEHNNLSSMLDRLETYTYKMFNLFIHHDIQPRIPTNRDYEELRDEFKYALDVTSVKKRPRLVPPTSQNMYPLPERCPHYMDSMLSNP